MLGYPSSTAHHTVIIHNGATCSYIVCQLAPTSYGIRWLSPPVPPHSIRWYFNTDQPSFISSFLRWLHTHITPLLLRCYYCTVSYCFQSNFILEPYPRSHATRWLTTPDNAFHTVNFFINLHKYGYLNPDIVYYTVSMMFPLHIMRQPSFYACNFHILFALPYPMSRALSIKWIPPWKPQYYRSLMNVNNGHNRLL